MKTYEELNNLFVSTNVLKKEELSKIKLKGSHLYNAIDAYYSNLQSRGTVPTAKQDMVTNLMNEQKVTSKSVAESIVNWLYRTYFEKAIQQQEKQEWEALKSIKNEMDKKLQRMRETIPNIPSTLYDEKLEIRVRFRKEKLVPSICFGPTLPPNKYDEYYSFLGRKDSEAFVNLSKHFL